MELTPREKDKLLLFTAALLAERRKAPRPVLVLVLVLVAVLVTDRPTTRTGMNPAATACW